MIRFALASLLCLAASLAQAAGFQRIEVPASGALPPLKGAVWYPCARPPGEMKIGPTVTEDCPMAGGKLPLVVISHGRGGDFLGHHDTAEALADAGFVAVAINHPGDTASDKSRIDDPSVFLERPADIKRTIGNAAGTRPRPAHQGGRDRRPVRNLLRRRELSKCQRAVQLRGSERGGDGVTPENVRDIAGWLPMKPDFHVAPNSQHFDFLAPCSADLAKMVPAICVDADRFDRAAFHKEFNADVVAFLLKHLGDAQQQ